MSSIKITIAMAVYNADIYLAHAIDSVLKQDFTDWELICVDDGSQDNSLSILNEFQDRDSRIKVLSQKNAGPSTAREQAYLIARGEYCIQIDSDDFISKDFLSSLYNTAIKSGADSVMPDLMLGAGNDEGEYRSFNNMKGLHTGLQLTPRNAFLRTFPWSVHGVCLWRTNLIKQHATGENAHINNYNADEYITRILFLSSNYTIISGGKYFYRSNEKSITKTPDLKRLSGLDTNDKLLKMAEEANFNKDEILLIINFQLITFMENLLMVIKNEQAFSFQEKQLAHEKLSDVYSRFIGQRGPSLKRTKGRVIRLFGFLSYERFASVVKYIHRLL